MVQASPKKLNSGDWGAWVKSENVQRGDVVAITTKSGKSWNSQIDKVIWRGNGGAICSLIQNNQSYRKRPRGEYAPFKRGVWCEGAGCYCPEDDTAFGACYDCL